MINLWQQSAEQNWQMMTRRCQFSKMKTTSIQPIWFTQPNSWPHSEMGQAGLTCHSSHRKLHLKVNWKSPRWWPTGDTIPPYHFFKELKCWIILWPRLISTASTNPVFCWKLPERKHWNVYWILAGWVLWRQIVFAPPGKMGHAIFPPLHTACPGTFQRNQTGLHTAALHEKSCSLNIEDKVPKLQIWWSEFRKNLGRIPPEENHLQYNATFFLPPPPVFLCLLRKIRIALPG